MYCNKCDCEVKDFKKHEKSNKHNDIKKDKIKKVYKYDHMKEYQKNYNNIRNEKGKEEVFCVTCNKNIKKYNLQHHNKTKKHLIKSN